MTTETPLGRPWEDLRTTGLLWLINRSVFHPRGYALALHTDDSGTFTGWSLQGDGTEPWSFPQGDDKELFKQALMTLRQAAGTNPLIALPPLPDTASPLHKPLEDKLWFPIVFGLEDPLGTERAQDWATYVIAWALEVVDPVIAEKDALIEKLRESLSKTVPPGPYPDPDAVGVDMEEVARNVSLVQSPDSSDDDRNTGYLRLRALLPAMADELKRLLEQNTVLYSMVSRMPDQHMLFGVVGQPPEAARCADWCWACKNDALTAQVAELTAALQELRAKDGPQ